MTYELLKQWEILGTLVTVSAASQSPGAAKAKDAPDSFEALLRQKAERTPEARKDAGKESPKAESSEAEGREELRENGTQPEEDQAPDAQRYAMAAALTAQVQPVAAAVIPNAEPLAQQGGGESAQAAAIPAEQTAQTALLQPQQEQQTAQVSTVQAGGQAFQEVMAQARPQAVQAPAAQESAAQAGAQEQQPEELQEASQALTAAQTPQAQTGRQEEGLSQEGAQRSETAQQAEGQIREEKPQELPQESPVFEHLESVPVKVSQPEQPRESVEVYAPDAPERLAEKLAAAQEAGASHVELTLTPESMGKLTVELNRSGDGSLSVVIHASTPKAAQLLEHHSDGLRQLLAAGNQGEVRVEIRTSQEPQAQQQFLNPDGHNGREEQQAQQQAQRERQEQERRQQPDRDFLQRLRLGLADVSRV